MKAFKINSAPPKHWIDEFVGGGYLAECESKILGEYREHLTRWLQARRDYPYDRTDEPDCVCARTRAEVMREFERTF